MEREKLGARKFAAAHGYVWEAKNLKNSVGGEKKTGRLVPVPITVNKE